jgi:hypothetical protein
MPGNGWLEYQKLVLSELERLDQDIKGLRKEIAELHDDTLQLKLKAGIWGAVGAAIPVTMLLAIQFLK